MGRIFLKEQVLDVETNDFIEFNKILKQNEKDLLAFSYNIYGREIVVFLDYGIIEVDDKVFFKGQKTEDKKRWISFRRKSFELSMNGEKSNEQEVCYGFGWQTEKIKKIILINPNGDIENG